MRPQRIQNGGLLATAPKVNDEISIAQIRASLTSAQFRHVLKTVEDSGHAYEFAEIKFADQGVATANRFGLVVGGTMTNLELTLRSDGTWYADSLASLT